MLTTTLRIWSVGPGIVSITLYFDFLRVYWITVLATETSWTFLLTLPTKYVPLSAWTPEMQSSAFTTSIHSLMISYKLLLRNTWYDKSLKFRERVCSSVLLAQLCDWSENSYHHLSETDATPIPIVTCPHWFSRASGSSIDFTFRFHQLLMMSTFVLIVRNYFNNTQSIWVLTLSTHQVKLRR